MPRLVKDGLRGRTFCTAGALPHGVSFRGIRHFGSSSGCQQHSSNLWPYHTGDAFTSASPPCAGSYATPRQRRLRSLTPWERFSPSPTNCSCIHLLGLNVDRFCEIYGPAAALIADFNGPSMPYVGCNHPRL